MRKVVTPGVELAVEDMFNTTKNVVVWPGETTDAGLADGNENCCQPLLSALVEKLSTVITSVSVIGFQVESPFASR